MTLFRDAADAAAEAWGYPKTNTVFNDTFERRIPEYVRDEIYRGLAEGAVTIDGYRFRLPDLGPRKGPYAFFSKNRAVGEPSPNWEYFVQLAEYLRVRRSAPPGLLVGFEDGLMDVSVRDGNRLLWYIEAKEKHSQAERLITLLDACAARVDMAARDRGNDALRKAKYLVKHRPPFFTVVAIDLRRDFAVRYRGTDAFELIEQDRPPQLARPAR